MKLKTAIPSLAAALLAAVPIANAQNATTAPVGFTNISIRGKTTAARALTLITIPMERATAFTGIAPSSITTESNRTVLTFPSPTFTANQFNGAGNAHYLKLTSGTNAGDYSQIFATSTNSITLSDNLTSVITSGVTTFEVVPYWTFSTAFPQGSGLNGNPDPTVADNVSLYNSNFSPTTYYYNNDNSDPEFPAGWYTTAGINADNTIIPPGAGLNVDRKLSSNATVQFVGEVPQGTTAVQINGSTSAVRRNTIVGSAYPLASKTLQDSGLYTGNVTTGVKGNPDPTLADLIQIFNSAGVPSSYYYNDDNSDPEFPAGWYTTSGTPANNVTIPEGSAVLVTRKSGTPFTWYVPQPNMNL